MGIESLRDGGNAWSTFQIEGDSGTQREHPFRCTERLTKSEHSGGKKLYGEVGRFGCRDGENRERYLSISGGGGGEGELKRVGWGGGGWVSRKGDRPKAGQL